MSLLLKLADSMYNADASPLSIMIDVYRFLPFLSLHSAAFLVPMGKTVPVGFSARPVALESCHIFFFLDLSNRRAFDPVHGTVLVLALQLDVLLNCGEIHRC